MQRSRIAISALCLSSVAAVASPPPAAESVAQVRRSGAGAVLLPAQTPLTVYTETNLPMKQGQAVRGRLAYPVYVRDVLVFPQGAIVDGRVVALRPDRSHRMESRLRADFTPFRTPTVQFDAVELPDGGKLPIQTDATGDGAAVLRLTPPPPRKGGFVRQRIADGKQLVRDRLALVTGPDKKDRLVQLLYTQLPYHPQRISQGTSWTVETSEAVTVSESSLPPAPAGLIAPKAAAELKPVAANVTAAQTWTIQAYLRQALSSKDTRRGQAVLAEVAEPILNPDGTVAVPQGAMLEGEVTQVRPARMFARPGVLRFDLRRLTLPDGGPTETVRSSIVGIDAAADQNLKLGSEGEVRPKPQDKIAVPIILFALASRPLDRDHGDGGGDGLGKNAVASNSLGVAGFLVGTVGGWRNVASGIGFYGTAISVYNRWIKRGAETSFRRDTRIVLETTTRRSGALPIAQQSQR